MEQIELIEARLSACPQCDEIVYAHLICGEAYDCECQCGHEFNPDDVMAWDVAHFFDCTECGREVVLSFPEFTPSLEEDDSLHDWVQEIPEEVDCPFCDTVFEIECIISHGE